MRAFLSVVVALSVVLTSCNFPPKENRSSMIVHRQMAEFETIDAIRLIWSATDHKKGESVEKVILSIVDALINNVNIVISCSNQDALEAAKAILNAKYPNSNRLSFQVIPSVEIWTRDMGPIFVETENGKLAIADFNFNVWGYADTLDAQAKTEEKYDENVAKLLDIPVISSPMISEGGNRELNGKGTIMVTEAVEKGRNPNMTIAAMEAEYRRLLGVKKVIWLKQGLVEDSHTFLGPIAVADNVKAYTVITTNGHVDEFARFINDSTILMAKVDSMDWYDAVGRENNRRMEENFTILSTSTDQDGKPFNIIRMPLPPTILTTLSPGDYVYEYIKTLDYTNGSKFPDGDMVSVIVPASYLNFIIANNVIIGQKYWRDGMPEIVKQRDEAAAKVLSSVFPNKKIILLDALAVNLGGGGLHCISMHQPKIVPN